MDWLDQFDGRIPNYDNNDDYRMELSRVRAAMGSQVRHAGSAWGAWSYMGSNSLPGGQESGVAGGQGAFAGGIDLQAPAANHTTRCG